MKAMILKYTTNFTQLVKSKSFTSQWSNKARISTLITTTAQEVIGSIIWQGKMMDKLPNEK
jgi:hypothetical protein